MWCDIRTEVHYSWRREIGLCLFMRVWIFNISMHTYLFVCLSVRMSVLPSSGCLFLNILLGCSNFVLLDRIYGWLGNGLVLCLYCVLDKLSTHVHLHVHVHKCAYIIHHIINSSACQLLYSLIWPGLYVSPPCSWCLSIYHVHTTSSPYIMKLLSIAHIHIYLHQHLIFSFLRLPSPTDSGKDYSMHWRRCRYCWRRRR